MTQLDSVLDSILFFHDIMSNFNRSCMAYLYASFSQYVVYRHSFWITADSFYSSVKLLCAIGVSDCAQYGERERATIISHHVRRLIKVRLESQLISDCG